MLSRRSGIHGFGSFLLGLWCVVASLAAPAVVSAQQSIEQREAALFGESSDSDSDETQPADDESSELDESAGEHARREEAIFGEGEVSSDESSTEPGASESDVFDSGTNDLESRLAAQVQEATDKLTLGGLLVSQLGYEYKEQGRAQDFALRAPNTLDAYLDGRPTDRLRVYVRGRLFHRLLGETDAAFEVSEGGSGPTEVVLDQLWLKFDIAREVYVTLGRQHLRWGVGRVWYPNDFLFNERFDPTAVYDARVGANLLKIHWPLESLGANVYAIANFEGASTPGEVGGALRGEFLVGETELGASLAFGREHPFRLATDVSAGLPWFEIRGELGLLHGVEGYFWKGPFDLSSFESDDISEWTIPQAVFREDEWILQGLVGLESGIEYGDNDILYYGLEYFYNGRGYDNEELYPWLIFSGQFVPLYNGRHYGAVFMEIPQPGGWNDTSFTWLNLANLSDWSFASRLEMRMTVLTRLSLFATSTYHGGSRGEFNFRLEVPPLPGAGLDQGLIMPATRVSFTGGFILQF